ncbi:hypothetical protein SAMN06265377_2420 [Flagellimonas pacifica]|uniref:Uncharacterized protein n=1 Tax=Flagellimonas pacifica TaxID=1247520 RepID=A0A285MXR9_9FLAO|nr:hypothetical protein SAMN06265377_2420 [Allomuricauda parva]
MDVEYEFVEVTFITKIDRKITPISAKPLRA